VRGSVFLNHHFGSFDDGADRVAFLEFEFVGAPAGDGALDKIVAHTNDDVGHDIAQLNFLDFSTQFVSG
jgi:hypothetical protein